MSLLDGMAAALEARCVDVRLGSHWQCRACKGLVRFGIIGENNASHERLARLEARFHTDACPERGRVTLPRAASAPLTVFVADDETLARIR